jgi:hypothetical protein
MQQQNAAKHARYVPGFHVITFGIILAALVVAISMTVSSGFSAGTLFALLASAGMCLLFWYIRAFATGNQDRIIRVEEQFRYYRLTGKPLDDRLTRAQVIALRFAGDGELVALADRAVQEQMSPAAIKQAIQQWRADHHRI